jgi:2-dehydro-3-deoxyphosphogluconate aldolase/(4S)-4-hydroxy-2-oxoglutarate aldolase
MSEQDVFDRIATVGVVAVVTVESVEHAIPLADALLAGGLSVAEITFRTEAAPEAIEAICSNRPDLLIGAGTILSIDQAQAAKDAGAKFALAPGLNPMVVEAARRIELPFMPGVCTPSDVEAALSCDCSVLKIFPAEVSGGVAMIKALHGPYGHTGVRFVPTGGVNSDNLASYLSAPGVCAVGGTWLAKPADLASGAWDTITQRCVDALETVKAARV